jgi:hypothetical protein
LDELTNEVQRAVTRRVAENKSMAMAKMGKELLEVAAATRGKLEAKWQASPKAKSDDDELLYGLQALNLVMRDMQDYANQQIAQDRELLAPTVARSLSDPKLRARMIDDFAAKYRRGAGS